MNKITKQVEKDGEERKHTLPRNQFISKPFEFNNFRINVAFASIQYFQ